MKLLLDSANQLEITDFLESFAISGVTTNPSLVASQDSFRKHTWEDYLDLVKDLYRHVCLESAAPRHLSVEVITLDPNEMLGQARAIAKATGERITIKIPVAVDTLPVISNLVHVQGINVNATACMTALQAKMASDAGAQIVSFFYNRMVDWVRTRDGAPTAEIDAFAWAQAEIKQFRQWRFMSETHAEIICGSIRRAVDVSACFNSGADYVTASAKVLREIIEHPKTIESITGFQKDIEAWLG